jgi:hypothetical protein
MQKLKNDTEDAFDDISTNNSIIPSDHLKNNRVCFGAYAIACVADSIYFLMDRAVITFYLLHPHKLTNKDQSQIQSV